MVFPKVFFISIPVRFKYYFGLFKLYLSIILSKFLILIGLDEHILKILNHFAYI